MAIAEANGRVCRGKSLSGPVMDREKYVYVTGALHWFCLHLIIVIIFFNLQRVESPLHSKSSYLVTLNYWTELGLKKTKITEKITYVQPDSMLNFTSCAGIMIDSRQNVWIDMNMGPDQTVKLLKKEQPDACLITHYHLDHSIWTRHVNAHTDAAVFIPKKEEKYLTSLSYVIEHTAGIFGMAEPWQNFVVNSLGYEALENYTCYTDKTVLAEQVPEMVVIETPGHSPGHTSFYFPDDNILFSGDLGLDRFGPWYGWADGNIENFVNSILKLDGLEIHLILTSHGGILEKQDIPQVFRSSIAHMIHREKQIVRQLDAGKSDEQIVDNGVFYTGKAKVKDPMRSFLDMWDTSMYRHHKSLIDRGGLRKFFPEIFRC